MAKYMADAAFIDTTTIKTDKIIDTSIVESAIESLHVMYDSISNSLEHLYPAVKEAMEEDEYGEMINKYGNQIRNVRVTINEFDRILHTLQLFEGINMSEQHKDRYTGGETSLNDMIGNCRDMISHHMEGFRQICDAMAVKFWKANLDTNM